MQYFKGKNNQHKNTFIYLFSSIWSLADPLDVSWKPFGGPEPRFITTVLKDKCILQITSSTQVLSTHICFYMFMYIGASVGHLLSFEISLGTHSSSPWHACDSCIKLDCVEFKKDYTALKVHVFIIYIYWYIFLHKYQTRLSLKWTMSKIAHG